MTATVNAGPFISVGQCMVPTDANGLPAGAGESNPDAGPSLSYQGDGFLDPRFYVQKDYMAGRNGTVISHLNSPYILSCDQIPAASAATPVNIAANQAGTTAALALATASVGISLGVPFLPFKSQTVVSAPIALDFGFLCSAASAGADTLSINGTATATASSLLSASNFYPGQWLYIANGASATVGSFHQVTAVAGTSVTLSPAPANTTSTAMVGTCNIPNTSWIGNPSPTAVFPYLAGGVGGFLDPKQSIMRGVGVNAAAGATATSCTIAGWDIYGQPQTEQITVTAGSTVYGSKTWKYIASATLNAADAGHTYSVGTSDLFGFVVRTDRWEYTNIFWNGAFIAAQSSATGVWVGGDLTSPATATTKDVRGVFQPSNRGPNGTAAATAANGTIRLALFTSLPLYNVISASPSNPTPLYGTKPA